MVAINGFALGGGFELCLAASYRVMADDTRVGFPETKLGIFPGWGGTVRFPRLVGADNAIEWIASGEQWSAADALKIGAVDGVVAKADLRDVAIGVLKDAAAGGLDWRKRRAEKTGPLELDKIESAMVFETSKAFVGGKAGPNYPAPIAAIEAIEKAARKGRDEALPIETEAFVRIARTPVAAALVSVFLGDLMLKKIAKKASKAARKVESAAVLGAGIMGGGIAYQSAAKRIPIVMKDINPKAIDLGLAEAGKLLEKQVSRGKMTPAKMAETLGRIRPTLSYGDFGAVDFVVEAVVENEKVKKAVLAEVEALLKPGAILASNTSTISITRLAESLKRPEDFCGMHFFNPVPKMPLVEVIRGKKSSEATIATAVAYALAMGKTPVVVNDCAGFFVNRVLFPYFAGFMKLVAGRGRLHPDRQGDGEVGLADGAGLPSRRRRDRHRCPRRQGDGGGLPRPDGPRREDGQRGDVRGGAVRAEERKGVLRLQAREEGAAKEDARPGGRRAPRADRQAAERPSRTRRSSSG